MSKPGEAKITPAQSSPVASTTAPTGLTDESKDKFKDLKNKIENHPIFILITGFGIAFAAVVTILSLGFVKLTTSHTELGHESQIKRLQDLEDKLRGEYDAEKIKVLEADTKRRQLESDLQANKDITEKFKDVYSLERGRLLGESDSIKRELLSTRDEFRREFLARSSAESQLAKEQKKTLELSKTFMSLQTLGLWEGGSPSPKVYLLIQGLNTNSGIFTGTIHNTVDKDKISEYLDNSDTPTELKARMTQAIYSLSVERKVCERLEKKRSRLNLKLPDHNHQDAIDKHRELTEDADDEAFECWEEINSYLEMIESLLSMRG